MSLHMRYVVDNSERRSSTDRRCNDQLLELDLLLAVPQWVLDVARKCKWDGRRHLSS